jgi:hypothetical protein
VNEKAVVPSEVAATITVEVGANAGVGDWDASGRL